MTMLTFSAVTDDARNVARQMVLDPNLVESVVESSLRPAGWGGYVDVAIITMASGEKHTVFDHSRDAVYRIRSAREMSEENQP